ncbi:hypothetical protein Tco_1153808 [Tanacetum coccineum]
MFATSLHWDRRKGIRTVDSRLQVATECHLTTMARHPEVPQCNKIGHFAREIGISTGNTNVLTPTRAAMGNLPKGMVVNEAEHQTLKRTLQSEIGPKLKKEWGNGMLKSMGLCRFGYLAQKQEGTMHQGNPDCEYITFVDHNAIEKLVSSFPNGNETLTFLRTDTSAKKEEEKSERKNRGRDQSSGDFQAVFPNMTCPGLSTARPVEIQIDLVPGAAHI